MSTDGFYVYLKSLLANTLIVSEHALMTRFLIILFTFSAIPPSGFTCVHVVHSSLFEGQQKPTNFIEAFEMPHVDQSTFLGWIQESLLCDI